MSSINKNYSVFVDNRYYPDFVALYNSWKYYENKIPIKVYVVGELSSDKRSKIENVCEVINVPQNGLSHNDFNRKQLFKYIALQNFMNEYEIILDADILFLSNTDFLFDYIEAGKIVGATENIYKYVHKIYLSTEEKFNIIKNELSNYLEKDIIEKYNFEFTNEIINGGFLGYNRHIHLPLFENVIKLLTVPFSNNENLIFHNEQYMASFLIKLFNYDTCILPNLEWMNTWDFHKFPKKILKIENGKFELHNEGGNRINLYHFTGGIGMPIPTGDLWPCRPHRIFEEANIDPFTRKDVEELWYKKLENPALLLYEFFHNKGI